MLAREHAQALRLRHSRNEALKTYPSQSGKARLNTGLFLDNTRKSMLFGHRFLESERYVRTHYVIPTE